MQLCTFQLTDQSGASVVNPEHVTAVRPLDPANSIIFLSGGDQLAVAGTVSEIAEKLLDKAGERT